MFVVNLVLHLAVCKRGCVCGFVQEFFEELEDLKFKYAQATERCKEYDIHLAICTTAGGRK